MIAAYVGVDATTPVDVAAGQGNTTSASIVAPSLTTSVDNALLVMVAGTATTASVAPATGLREQLEVAGTGKAKVVAELADALLGNAGSTGSRTAVATRAGANVGHLIAIRPSGSPPPPDPTSAPSAPQTLAASASSGKVTLTWAAPTNDGGATITGYRVYRATTSGNETLLATIGTALTYQDLAVTNGTRYFYTVAAVNSVGTGALSNEASATPSGTAATVPGAPTSLTAAPLKPRGVLLSWTAPSSNGGSAITGYQIFRSTTAGGEVFLVSVGNVGRYKDTTATSGVTYFYWVEAVNAVGASAHSNEASAIAR